VKKRKVEPRIRTIVGDRQARMRLLPLEHGV